MIPPDLLALRQAAVDHQTGFQHTLQAWTRAHLDPHLHVRLPLLRASCHVAGAAYETALDRLITHLQATEGDADRDAERQRAQRMRELLHRELAIVDRGTEA